jgi:hypothetical protein
MNGTHNCRSETIYVLTPEAPMKPGRCRSLKFNIATVEFQGVPATEIALLMNGRIFETLKKAR